MSHLSDHINAAADAQATHHYISPRQGRDPRTDGSPRTYDDVLPPMWHAKAACFDAPEVFLEAEIHLDQPGPPSECVLAYALALCADCPVRDLCDQAWREDERGDRHTRAGIRAGLTPVQRAEIAREEKAA